MEKCSLSEVSGSGDRCPRETAFVFEWVPAVLPTRGTEAPLHDFLCQDHLQGLVHSKLSQGAANVQVYLKALEEKARRPSLEPKPLPPPCASDLPQQKNAILENAVMA
ncbi:hypothetical protein P7K49_039086 [Saguinus oedipus]|uniref:Uncharacterized protein n=1 Tax=Saguinus oedipus TaxID=9490 RepID=A0ABQ9TGX4_SAGOE|nr:hypothetical protein P7K49_039086 [Saguinus oedipus]